MLHNCIYYILELIRGLQEKLEAYLAGNLGYILYLLVYVNEWVKSIIIKG